jgi:hypothetical protein
VALNLAKNFKNSYEMAVKAIEFAQILLLDLGPSIYKFQSHQLTELSDEIEDNHLMTMPPLAAAIALVNRIRKI